MGYLGVSSRIAALSLGLLALSGCQDKQRAVEQGAAGFWPDQPAEDVVCPSPDPRCNGLFDDRAQVLVPDTRLCVVTETRLAYICGDKPPGLRCPGPGCPTGRPGDYNSDPARKCHLQERYTYVQCPKTPGPGPVEGGAAQGDPPKPTVSTPTPAPQ